MRKVFLLYQNEMGKTVRKVSILVAMILMFVFIGGCALTYKGVESFTSYYWQDYGHVSDEFKKDAEAAEAEAVRLRAVLQTLDPETDKDSFAEYADQYLDNLTDQTRAQLLARLYRTAAEAITRRNYSYDSIFETMNDRIYDTFYYNNAPVETMEALKAEEHRIVADTNMLNAELDQLEYVFLGASFREMLDRRQELLESSGTADGSYAIYKEVYGWLDKYADKVDVSASDYILAQADNYVSNRMALNAQTEDQPDQQGVSFSAEKLEKEIALQEYALKHGTVIGDAERANSPVQNRSIMNQLCNTGTYIVIALVIMLAGSAISSEMNNSSIKSLIIAPVRRGKIFAAKGLALLTVQTALLLFSYLLSLLFTGMLFGFRNFGTVVYYAFGAAHGMPYLAAAILSMLLDGLAIGLFAALALALSSLTHNTAVSVTLPLLGIFGGLLAELIMLLGGGRPYIAALLPIHNLANLHRITGVPSIFEVFNSEYGADAAVTPLFSWIYVILLLTALVWCAYDAFCRKDIT
ncbi:MAG: ABC transporter permease [Clostridia bacterium]|nr:ABC transporter permease [Clostridia bacterium]